MKKTIITMLLLVSVSWIFPKLLNIPQDVRVYSSQFSFYEFMLLNDGYKHNVMVGTLPLKHFDLNLGLYSYYKSPADSVSRNTMFPFGISISPVRKRTYAISLASDMNILGEKKLKEIFSESYCKFTLNLMPKTEPNICFSLIGGYRYFFDGKHDNNNGLYYGASLSFGGFFTRDVTAQAGKKVREKNYQYSLRMNSLDTWSAYLDLQPEDSCRVNTDILDSAIKNSSSAQLESFAMKHQGMSGSHEKVKQTLRDLDHAAWQRISASNQAEKAELCKAYLSGFPQGIFLDQVRQVLFENDEAFAWETINATFKLEECRKYLAIYPSGPHRATAELYIEFHDHDLWRSANKGGDLQVFHDYQRLFPEGLYIKEVESILKDTALVNAYSGNDPDALIQYIQEHPNSSYKNMVYARYLSLSPYVKVKVDLDSSSYSRYDITDVLIYDVKRKSFTESITQEKEPDIVIDGSYRRFYTDNSTRYSSNEIAVIDATFKLKHKNTDIITFDIYQEVEGKNRSYGYELREIHSGKTIQDPRVLDQNAELTYIKEYLLEHYLP